MRRAGFHARGSGDRLRTDFRHNRQMGCFFERRIGVASDGDGLCTLAAGIGDGGDGKWSSSAGGDSDHHVRPARFLLGHFPLAQLAGIFIGFDCNAQSFRSSRHHVLNRFRIEVEGRRTLGGIECRNAAARAGAHIEQAATSAESMGDQVDGACNLRQGAFDRGRDLPVFEIDDARDFER